LWIPGRKPRDRPGSFVRVTSRPEAARESLWVYRAAAGRARPLLV